MYQSCQIGSCIFTLHQNTCTAQVPTEILEQMNTFISNSLIMHDSNLHQRPSPPTRLRISFLYLSHQTTILNRRMQLRSRDTLTISTGKSDKDFDLPFIPHFTVVGLTPHGNFDFGGGGDVEGCLYKQRSACFFQDKRGRNERKGEEEGWRNG